MPNEPRSHTARRAAAALALVSIPALLSTFETVMFARIGGRPIAAWRAFVGEAPQWYTWVVLAPAIVAVAKRWRLRWPPAVLSVAAHAAACLASSAIVAWADAIVNHWVRPSSAWGAGAYSFLQITLYASGVMLMRSRPSSETGWSGRSTRSSPTFRIIK